MILLDPVSYRKNEVVSFRHISYLINSRLDLLDFWLNINILSVGLCFLLLTNSVSYSVLVSYNNFLFPLLFVITGLLNLSRLFYIQKIKNIWIHLCKHLTLLCYLILCLDLIINAVLPIHILSISFLILAFESVYSIIIK